MKGILIALVILLAEGTMATWIDQDCDVLGTQTTLAVGGTYQVSCRYDKALIDSAHKLQFYRNKICLENSQIYLDTKETPEGNAFPMTSNATELNEYLEATGRYSVEKTAEGDDFVEYTMTITGVQEEDLGTIGCQRIDVSVQPASYKERSVEATLHVEGPTLETSFYVREFCDNPAYANHPACAEDDDKVELHTGQEFTFHSDEACHVEFEMKYSNLRPTQVEVYIADDEGDVFLDLPTKDAPTSSHESSATVNGPLVTTNVTGTYFSMKFVPLHTYNRKQVYVRVTRSVFPEEVLTVVEELSVTFPPTEASCETDKDTSGPNPSLIISCQALANPPAVARWTRDNFGAINASDKYVIESKVHDDRTVSSLTIVGVTSEKDTGDYTVVFENVHDSSVVVTKVDDSVIATGSGNRVRVSLILGFLFVLLTSTIGTDW